MFKKFATAFTASAIMALGLVSIVGASTGDSFAVKGLGDAGTAVGAEYVNFTIANGDPNEEGEAGGSKVQAAIFVGHPSAPLHIGAGDDTDKPVGSGLKALLNIGASDPREQ